MNDEKKCADKVQDAAASRLADLKAMLDPSAEDLSVERVKDTDRYRIEVGEDEVTEIDRDELETYWAGDGDMPDDPANWTEDETSDVLENLWGDYEDKAREEAREAFCEYGLCFDYVTPDTFCDIETGYWRYQISWGGPSEEIRFYGTPGRYGWHMGKAEFWYLDWFDGAHIRIDRDDAEMIWAEFNDTGMVESALEEAKSDD